MYSPYAALFRDTSGAASPSRSSPSAPSASSPRSRSTCCSPAARAPRRAARLLRRLRRSRRSCLDRDGHHLGAQARPLLQDLRGHLRVVAAPRRGGHRRRGRGRGARRPPRARARRPRIRRPGYGGPPYGGTAALERGRADRDRRRAPPPRRPAVAARRLGPRARPRSRRVPALLYVGALPSYGSYITSCGKLEKPDEPTRRAAPHHAPGRAAAGDALRRPALPDLQGVPPAPRRPRASSTSSTSRWCSSRSTASATGCSTGPSTRARASSRKAVLCGEHRALQVLEWAYENQEEILDAAKAGAGTDQRAPR